MSQTIDKKVVEMFFDNSQFETNVATSMSTLDKLKNALNFSKSSTGLDGLGRAVKNVSFDGMTSGIDTVASKFKALDVVAFTTIQRMTNAAIDAGKNLVKSLSVDNISAGFTKYGQKTSAVATLVAQGYELDTVNDQLERLNWFTDETSYNFTDMVESIAKFTATGQELEPSVTAMEGIATWAALSGQNATKASSAMYQLSQAMGAGVMRREDYRSIQTLSMDTAEFRQNALDAAVELGTLKKVGTDTYQSLVADTKEGMREFNVSQFADNLTKGAWFTSDVMMQVFNKYSSAVGDIYEYAEEKGITASQAMKEMGGTLDEFGVKAFKAAQEARTFQDVIDSVKDAASTAWMNTFELIFGDYEQATKLWTDMANEAYDIFVGPVNSLNEILEGALLTKETKSLTWEDITGLHLTTEQGQGLIKMLKSVAREHGVAIDQIIDEEGSFRESLKTGWLSSDIFEEALGKFTGSTTSAVMDVEELKKLVNEVIQGSWGDDWTTRINKMTEAGYSEEQIQLVRDYVNKIHELTEGNWSLKDSVWEAANAELGNAEALAALSDEELKSLGLTDKEIAGLRQLAKQAEETGTPLNELYKSLSEGKTGRELLLESFGNIYGYLKSLVEPIGKAWSAVFGGDASKGISDLIIKFNRFSKSLQLSIRTSTKLKNAFKGFFSVLKILENIFGALGGEIFSVLVKALSDLGGFLLNADSGFGRYITKVAKAAEESKIFQKIIHTLFAPLRALQSILGKVLDFGGKFIGSVFNKLSARFPEITEKFNNLINALTNTSAFEKIQELSSKAFTSIMNFLGIKFDDSNIDEKANSVVDSIINSLETLTNSIEKADAFIRENGIEGVFQYIKDKIVEGIKSIPKAIHDAIFGAEKDIPKDGLQDVIESGVEDFEPDGVITYIASHIGSAITDVLSGISTKLFGTEITEKLQSFFSGAFSVIGDAFSNIGEGIGYFVTNIIPDIAGYISEKAPQIGKVVRTALGGLLEKIGITPEKIDLFTVIKSVMAFLAGMSINKFLSNLAKVPKSLSKVFDNLSGVFKSVKKVADASSKNFKASALLKNAEAFALIVGVLTAAIFVLGNMKPEQLDQGIKATLTLAIIAGIIIGVFKAIDAIGSISIGKKSPLSIIANGISDALNNLTSSFKGVGTGALMAGIGIAIVLLVKAFTDLMKVDWSKAKPAIAGMIAMVGGLVGVVMLLKNTGGNVSIGTVLSFLSIALAIKMLVPALVSLSRLTWDEMIKGIVGLSAMLGALSLSMRITGKNGSIGSAVAIIAMAAAINMLVKPVQTLGKMNLKNLAKGIGGISALMLALSGAMAITSKFGKGFTLITASVFVIALSALIFAISLLPVDTAMPVILSLSVLFFALSGAIGILGTLPPVAGLVAALNLIEFIGAIVFGIVGICELLMLIPNIDDVGNMFVKIGDVIGKFIGAIGAGISSALPEIGSNLGAFADNAQSFFDLGDDKIDNVKSVVGMLETLSNVAWQDFKTKLLSFGKSGLLETIQTSFVPLADAINDFASTLGPVDSSKIQSAQAIVDMLKTMSGLSEVTSISFLGLFSITTSKDLEGFGTGLSAVATGLGEFATTISGEDFGELNDETIQKAKDILNFMVEIQGQTAIENPTFFDCLGLFTGYNSLGEFGDGMGRVGAGLAEYVKAVNDIDFDEGQTEKAEKIITFMAGIQEQTAIDDPTFFDCLGLFTGYNSLGEFGVGMGKVGAGLAEYVKAVNDIDFDDGQSEKAEKIITFMAGIQDQTAIDDPTFFDCLSIFTG